MESISIKPKNASKTSKRYLHPGEEDLAFSKILSFYEIPPTSDVPLYELEQYCLKRLKGLYFFNIFLFFFFCNFFP